MESLAMNERIVLVFLTKLSFSTVDRKDEQMEENYARSAFSGSENNIGISKGGSLKVDITKRTPL